MNESSSRPLLQVSADHDASSSSLSKGKAKASARRASSADEENNRWVTRVRYSYDDEALLGSLEENGRFSPVRTRSCCSRTYSCIFSMKGFIWLLALCVAAVISWWFVHDEFPVVGVMPIHPSYCASFHTNNQPYYVLIKINSTPYRVIPDTGSSNLVVAASSCASCDVSPKMTREDPWPNSTSPGSYKIAYGTGAIVINDVSAKVTIAPPHLDLFGAKLGAIVHQNKSGGFNLFPERPRDGIMPLTPNEHQDTCYNTYAGVMGLAFSGQGAQAENVSSKDSQTTNGTKTQMVDQLSSVLGMPNAFAIELCAHYPWNCQEQRRLDNTTWLPNRNECGNKRVGSLFWGGYSSARTVSDMVWVQLTDEIHYDVQLLSVRVCGQDGCEDVTFPDQINGTNEDDCFCSTPKCDPGSVDYCYFSVVESGAGRIYMNTPRNAVALLEAMERRKVVIFPDHVARNESLVRAFYFNKTGVPGAHVAQSASLDFIFKGWQGAADARVPVILDGVIFRKDVMVLGENVGTVQWGIQGDLDVIAEYSKAKFPTLLGNTFQQGKTTFYDRSRARIGFAQVNEEKCQNEDADYWDINAFGMNAKPTPGSGCRRGTGSGGGCPQ